MHCRLFLTIQPALSLFQSIPRKLSFNFDSLPGNDFNLDKLPSKPLELKTSVLNPPAILKVLPPAPQKGKPLAISDFGLAQGFPGKIHWRHL